MTHFVFDHIHLRCPDPDRTAAFYVDVLGAKPLGRMERPKGIRVTVELGGVQLFIEQVPEATPGVPETPFLGMEHIALRVDGIDEVAAELKRKGVRFTVELHDMRPGVRGCFIEGPERVLIEVLERAG